MPENFGDQLAGYVDAASGATGAPPGAEAARKRGRQRRTRRRAAASALALALICGAGSAAALTLGNGPGHMPATGPSAVPSASVPAVPSVPPAAATTVAPTLSTPSHLSPSVDPDPATSGPVGEQTATTAPSPEVLVPVAWLGASQMPFADDGDYQLTEATGSQLGDSVALDRPPIEMCDEDINGTALSALGDGTSGQQLREFFSQGNVLPEGQAIAAYPAQQLLFYPNAATARSAWDALPADFASCKQQMTGVDPSSGISLIGSVQQTVAEPDAECWSTLTTGTGGSSTSNGDLTHSCFVRSGSLIAAVDVDVHDDGSFSLVDFGPTDASTISALRQALTAGYGSSG
jgi:hypothetical protein